MISKEEKIKLIKELAKKSDITPYEIGQKTSISSSSAQKIFSGEQSNPRTKTLNIILDFLEKEVAGTENYIDVQPQYQKVAEDSLQYNTNFKNLKIDDKLNAIYHQNTDLKHHLDVMANALSKLLLNHEELLETVNKQKN